MNNNTNQAIEILYPLGCLHCGWGHDDYKIDVVSLTSDQKKWIAAGQGSLNENVTCSCKMCGALYQAVKKIVPVQVETINCPTCGSSQNLVYNVTKLAKEKEKFEFEVTISCEKCKKVNSLKNVFSKILSMIKIEYKTAGISIKGE